MKELGHVRSATTFLRTRTFQSAFCVMTRHNKGRRFREGKYVIRFASLNPDEPKTRALLGTNRVLWTNGGERDPMAALTAERQEDGLRRLRGMVNTLALTILTALLDRAILTRRQLEC
jgi:hypothetical protein